MMKKFLPFSRRQPSLDRFAVHRGGWSGSDRFNGKSLRRTSATSLNTRSIQVVRGAYNIDLNKVDSSFTKLHRACLLNDDVQVRKHIQKADNNSHDSSNRYPIHLATVNGNFAIVKLLIENGADPNVQDNEGNTPLIKSIECGHEHLVKYLLNNNANPNISDMDNNSALHLAMMTESIIAVDALMSSKKCDLTLRNNRDETCLHLAVRCPLINTLTFDALLRYGSDLTAKDQLGLTAIDIAQACNNKTALSAFDRHQNCGDNSISLENSKNCENPANAINDEIAGAKHICDEYKLKYFTKNRENLEYEKRMIQLNATIERLKIDMSYLREQNEKLELNCEKLLEENNKLKTENIDLTAQIQETKQKSMHPEQSAANPGKPSPTPAFDGCHEITKLSISTGKLNSIDCRGHEEFLAAKLSNQEQINKLKSGLTTMQL